MGEKSRIGNTLAPDVGPREFEIVLKVSPATKETVIRKVKAHGFEVAEGGAFVEVLGREGAQLALLPVDSLLGIFIAPERTDLDPP